MENQWETFLDLQNGNEFQKLNHTLIFCSPNKKSLSKIKKLLFEKDGGVNDDFELITFFNVSLKSIMSNKSGSLDVYMLYTPTDLETIDLMNTFTKGICSTSRKLAYSLDFCSRLGSSKSKIMATISHQLLYNFAEVRDRTQQD